MTRLRLRLDSNTDHDVVVEDHAFVQQVLASAFDLDEAGAEGPGSAYRIEPDGSRAVRLHSPHRAEVRTLPRSQVADALLRELTHLRIVAGAGRSLHGGAVDLDGSGVVVVGVSGAGKSTLVCHLLSAGAELVNDEIVTVEPCAGVIEGFQRPVAIDPDGHSVVSGLTEWRPPAPSERWLLRPEAFRSRWTHTCRPVVLVFPSRRLGSVRVRPLSPAAAFERLCASNLDLVTDCAAGLAAYAWLAARARCIRLEYAEAAEAVPVIREATLARSAPELSWRVESPSGSGIRSNSWRGRFQGETYSVDVGGQTVLYASRNRAVIRLDPAAGRSWKRLARRRRPRRNDRRLLRELRGLGVPS